MPDIIVRRNGGRNPGEDIVDPLIATDAVALQRGRQELDENAQGFTPVSTTIVPRSGLQPGQVVEVNDSHQGASYRAKVTSVTLRHEFSDRAVAGRINLELAKVSKFQ